MNKHIGNINKNNPISSDHLDSNASGDPSRVSADEINDNVIQASSRSRLSNISDKVRSPNSNSSLENHLNPHSNTGKKAINSTLELNEENYVPFDIDEMPWWKIFLKYVGPGIMIAVGYIDPGNWATDLEGGSRFYYNLLFAILFANICAIFLQSLAIKIGIITGNDLAQCCRLYFNKYLNLFLYITAEIAIIATDLAEVIGSAIGLHLLFGISLPYGVALTGLDVLLILLGFDSKRLRLFEAILLIFFSIVALCFISLISRTNPIWMDVLNGFLPRAEIFTNKDELFLLIGIIGATVMPHNLYLQSNLVLYRYNPQATTDDVLAQSFNHKSANNNNTTVKANNSDNSDAIISSFSDNHQPNESSSLLRATDSEILDALPPYEIAKDYKTRPHIHERWIKNSLKYSYIDTTVSLFFAVMINCAILIVAASAFHSRGYETIASIEDAYELLHKLLGKGLATTFAVALLCSGQSSTIIGTITGQIVMNGFLSETGRIQRYLMKKPWLRRLMTRGLAIVPAMVVSILMGMDGVDRLLVISQVILSFQLPFAIIPLIYITSCSKYMTLRFEDEAKMENRNNSSIEYNNINSLSQNDEDRGCENGYNIQPSPSVSSLNSVDPLLEQNSNIYAVENDIAYNSTIKVRDYSNRWWHLIILGFSAGLVLVLNVILIVLVFAS